LAKQLLWKQELSISGDAIVWKKSALFLRSCKNLQGKRDKGKSRPAGLNPGKTIKDESGEIAE
jgi:hypothetical protein